MTEFAPQNCSNRFKLKLVEFFFIFEPSEIILQGLFSLTPVLFVCFMFKLRLLEILQSGQNQNRIKFRPISPKLGFTDPMLLKPKCVLGLSI